MSARRVDELIWMALTDSGFREGLLNGPRGEIVKEFGLTEEERRVALMAQADTLESFASVLCQQAESFPM